MQKFIFILIAVVAIFSNQAFTQTKKQEPKSSVLLNAKRPSVYIEFERRGKTSLLFEGESNRRIWLRLYNNTRWELSFCSLSVDKDYGNVGIVYDVERVNTFGSIGIGKIGEELTKPNIQEEPIIPQGYSTGDTCTPFYLASSKSVLFSVPQEHLAEKLYIKFEYWFDWENRDNELGDFPQSYVSFGNSQLP